MSSQTTFRAILVVAFLSFFLIPSLSAQTETPPKSPDEIIRVSTELVQTNVMVFDNQSRFVEGLKPEQFELKVNGAATPLIFVDRVTAGRRSQPQHPTTTSGSGSAVIRNGVTPIYRGRTIVFFVDDLHLSPESNQRTRKAILKFIENQIEPGDQVAIASASGQIGFLQQFTDVPPVLRAAIERLAYRPYTVRDTENIPMTEYSALQISQGDKYALEYYSSELLKATNFNAGGGLGPPRSGPYGGRPEAGQTPGITRDVAERLVKERAQMFLKQSAQITQGTLTTLAGLLKTTGQMSGNKLAFFVSDGFYLNDRDTGLGDKLKQITDAATRAGVVIYTVDARGLVSTTDAASNRADPAGLVSRSNVGEIAAAQDALTALADDTGGRAALNTGDLDSLVKDALQETSNYYLLGWKPTADEQKMRGFNRVEVNIIGRPELKVRLSKGFIGATPGDNKVAKAKDPADTSKGADGTLRAVFNASDKKELGTQLSVGFLDIPDVGPVLTTSMQVATEGMGHGPDGKQTAGVDIAGLVLNDLGKQVGGFKTRLNVEPTANSSDSGGGVIYSHRLPLKAGIYQVRVVAVDSRNGRSGSASKWIEVPDLAKAQLTLSSLWLSGQSVGTTQKQSGGQEQVQFSVDRRFARGGRLNFLTFVYNAGRGDNGLRLLEAQIKISRDGKTIVTSPLRSVQFSGASDPARIPYGADIALQTLPVGRYLLQVAVFDRVAKTSASQQVTFEIE